MCQQECLGALLIEFYFYLVVLRHFVPIDTDNCSVTEDTVCHAVAVFPNGWNRGLIVGDRRLVTDGYSYKSGRFRLSGLGFAFLVRHEESSVYIVQES